MYFCQSLLLIGIIFILAVHITQSQKDVKGPGKSSCSVSHTRKKDCGLPEVLLTDIPKDCTSLVFHTVLIDPNNEVVKTSTDDENDTLNILLESGKDVIIYYGRVEWTTMLANEASNGGKNSLKEMEALKTFLAERPAITAIVLIGLQYPVDATAEFPTYTDDFKKYLDVFRTTFPDLSIGLDIFGFSLIDQYTYPKFKWLNISVIDYAIDFYAVTTESFNLCSNEFKNTGIAPMDGNMNYTLEKLIDVLQKACIPKEKTYFKFRTTPTSPDNSLTLCDLNYEKMCTQPQVAIDWCSDTQLSFNEKGQYAQKHGVDFMVIFIDYDDPGNFCNCEKPYPAFHAILDGFNGISTKTCDLLKRP